MPFNIYQPDPGQIDPKYNLDSRFLYKNLEKFFSPGPVCAIFNTKSSQLLPVSVDGLEVKAGFKFKVEEAPKNGVHSFLADPCIFVAGLDVGKLQFSMQGLRSLDNGLLACDIPKEVALIQRREDFRVPAPPDRAFKALIYFSVGKEMIADIVDISDKGIQFDIRLGATELEVGKIWTGCTLERLQARTAKFDLIIRSIRPSLLEESRVRVGCELHEPTRLNENEFVSTRTAIQSSRVNRRINYWYQEASWC
ncbi:hypothetical protein [Polynucleobacter sp. AP-Ainpum-60-G11]|uniref:hypothetical protein n=1 Tax=Polynucleobacter sp. AP-Ainpum-60-G11 TaxID=2576926 RepID=UPI001BFDB823|nr:hypothetical protein [Polynucleobacter sp. AP-Ainpum-60-G11]QWE27126.1 PilZ domain-containing protein [Polynucleobacter sp. AP-Ainpum-60-G11]